MKMIKIQQTLFLCLLLHRKIADKISIQKKDQLFLDLKLCLS